MHGTSAAIVPSKGTHLLVAIFLPVSRGLVNKASADAIAMRRDKAEKLNLNIIVARMLDLL